MAEQIFNGYKRLFEVRMLHHYWLDEGEKCFDFLPKDNIERALLPLADQKLPTREQRLLSFDVRKFLEVSPTQSTLKILQGLHCVFKTTALGLVVAAPKDLLLPADTIFEFILTIKNSNFFNYTALTLRKQNIYELYYQPFDKIYRYKENVFTFSNESGSSKILPNPPNPPISQRAILFLSRPIPAFAGGTEYGAESFVGSLHQALQDHPLAAPPSAGWQTLTTPSNHPVYVHQDDISKIIPPVGLSGVPDRGVELTTDIPDNIFALIRIKTLQPTEEFSLLKNVVPANPADPIKIEMREPVFEIRFKNRSSIWKYYSRRIEKTETPDNSIFTEPDPLPLTFFGNASTVTPKHQKPNQGGIKVNFESNDPTKKVEKIISEIFE
ncbi:MAG TPA: hypothetical protein VFG10_07640 [Saprospiraceae bacterium]|nr:hypothetical protein [Saprospiraceae bacterium]